MATDLDLGNIDLNNISLEDLGSSLLSRQQKINEENQRRAKKQQRVTNALAVLGVGQKIFKNALNNRLKEIDNLQLFELQNNEEQFKRIRGMANILQNFDEDKLKALAGPNQEWATMSEDERVAAYMNSPYADLLNTSLGQSIDSAIEQGNIFDDFNAFKSNKELYNPLRKKALENAVRFYLQGNKYKEFGTELESLYGASGVTFKDKASMLEKAMSLTPHELTKLERTLFEKEKQQYRNVGVFQGIKHAFEKVGRKQSENGGINLFREITPETVYGNLDEKISALDITANLTNSVRDEMARIKGTDKESIAIASADEQGQVAMAQYITQFAVDSATGVRYNEDSAYGELLKMSGKKGRYNDFWNDISEDTIEGPTAIRDALALDYLFLEKPELAQAIYASKYEQLYGKPADETALKLFKSNFSDEVYRRQFAAMVMGGEGFKVRTRAWGNRGKEHYDGTGLVGNIQKKYSYDSFAGMLPVIRHDGVDTPAESQTNEYAMNDDWNKLNSNQQEQIFDAHYKNIMQSELKDSDKERLVENLFLNVNHPKGYNVDDYRAELSRDLYSSLPSFGMDKKIESLKSPFETLPQRRARGAVEINEEALNLASGFGMFETGAERRARSEDRKIELLKSRVNTLSNAAEIDEEALNDAEFDLFQAQLNSRPEEIYPDNPFLVSLLYEEEGLGKRNIRNLFKQNTKVYKDSEGHLTAGVGHLLTEEDKKIYKLGDEVPTKVVKQWFINDAREAEANSIQVLSERAPQLLDNKENEAMFASFFYQLGVTGGLKFEKMWDALQNGDYEEASKQALDSNWAKQTPERAQRFADFLLTLD